MTTNVSACRRAGNRNPNVSQLNIIPMISEQKNDSGSVSPTFGNQPVVRRYIWVKVAENNDYGSPSGKAQVIEFADCLKFEPDNFYGYAFRTSTKGKYKRVHLSGVIYPYRAIHEWYGNMVWNAYQIDTTSATAMINQLYKSGKWSVNEGYTELIDILESDGVLLEGDLIRVLSE